MSYMTCCICLLFFCCVCILFVFSCIFLCHTFLPVALASAENERAHHAGRPAAKLAAKILGFTVLTQAES